MTKRKFNQDEFDKGVAELQTLAKKGQLFQKIGDSAFMVGLLDGEIDIKMVIEMGAALLLNKPLVIIAKPGCWIPEKVRLVADTIIITDDITHDKAASDQFQAVLERYIPREQ